jgi:hypothetical protein
MASITAFDATGRRVPKGSRVRAARYVPRWRTPEGASREKWFERKIDAEKHLTSTEHRKLTGEYVDPLLGKVRFRTFAEGFIERKRTTARGSTVAPWVSYLKGAHPPGVRASRAAGDHERAGEDVRRQPVARPNNVAGGDAAPTGDARRRCGQRAPRP